MITSLAVEEQMAERLRLDIEPPVHGWATVRLTAPGVVLEFSASHTPRDSISDLARAAALVAGGFPEQVVVWNTEPAEYEFQFVTASGRTRLQIQEFTNARRQRGHAEAPPVMVETESLAVARALWRGLRRLQGAVPADEFQAAWGHPFPTTTIERLGQQLADGS
jgi:hypothetical protein